jgi:hypothetical protein
MLLAPPCWGEAWVIEPAISISASVSATAGTCHFRLLWRLSLRRCGRGVVRRRIAAATPTAVVVVMVGHQHCKTLTDKMTQPIYQIHHEGFNFDKTKLTKFVKPKLYHDVNIVNHDAEKLLHDLSGEGEVVRVIETKEGGMKVQRTYGLRKEVYSSYAKVVRVQEDKDKDGEVASEGEAVEKVEEK